ASSSSKAMETRLTNVEKTVGEIQGELGEIHSMLGEILQNLTITFETHKEPAKLALIQRKQILEKQDSGDDMAANINFPLNEGTDFARNLGKTKITRNPYPEFQMKKEHNPRNLYQARFKPEDYHK
ncbi:hypothetical protein Csa_023749, partial [Cucumis sativus]